MEEAQLTLQLKRTMRVYSYNNIDESRGLGVFKDLLNGKAIMEMSFDGENLQFLPHKCPEPTPPITRTSWKPPVKTTKEAE